MTQSRRQGERFRAISGESLWTIDVARVLRPRRGLRQRSFREFMRARKPQRIAVLQTMVDTEGCSWHSAIVNYVEICSWSTEDELRPAMPAAKMVKKV
jgi:hypothetical protein